MQNTCNVSFKKPLPEIMISPCLFHPVLGICHTWIACDDSVCLSLEPIKSFLDNINNQICSHEDFDIPMKNKPFFVFQLLIL